MVKGKPDYLQARPNVLFELGWFYGRLGRQKVTIIYQEGLDIPSELSGLVRVQFKDTVLDKVVDIEKELH